MLVYNFEGVPRNPLIVAVKNVLTLGIHTKIWLYRVNREMDGREGFHINFITLSVMLWLPFVTPAIVKFQTAARLNQMVSDPVTIPLIRARRLGWISLVPVVGAGFYAYWVQNSLNRFWFWHRRKERIQLNKEKIKETAAGPESEATLQRRLELEEECRRLEREMEEEIEAVRLKWGEERFLERKKRADLHAQRGRLSRKEVLDLRRKEKKKRKEEQARRRRERSLVARYKPRRADPEKDALWEPFTPLPRRMPDKIVQAAKEEDRELTRREANELKRAERLLAAREKETERLEKRRAKLLARKRRKEARTQAQAEKKALAGKKSKKVRGRRKKGEKEEAAPAAARRRLLVLPPKRDPEVDDHWLPGTPEPEVDPDQIVNAAESEGRELTKKERKAVEKAEKQLEKREKEQEALEKAREKAREKAEKTMASREAKQEKKRTKQERKPAAKTGKKPGKKKQTKEKREKQKKGKGKKGETKGKKERGDEAGGPKKTPVKTKKPKRSKPEQAKPEKTPEQELGSSPGAPVKVLNVRCPQCRTQVPVKKRDDRPARLKCPSCGLVGKV